jgi:hypothetical protein
MKQIPKQACIDCHFLARSTGYKPDLHKYKHVEVQRGERERLHNFIRRLPLLEIASSRLRVSPIDRACTF